MRSMYRAAIAIFLFDLSALSADNSLSSRLQIQIPTDLFKPLGYDHQEALFGIPPYGGSIAQRLLYPVLSNDSYPFTLCSDAEAKNFTNPTPDQPFILLIDRGGQNCTFVSKVRRAQHMGASGAIIADNTCLCSDVQCKSTDNPMCQIVEPIMADDGSGASITIPSFLMTKTDSDVIKERLQQKQFIQAEMTWSLPAPDDRVEWSMWTSALDTASTSFKNDFKEVAVALGRHAYFTPFYTIYDGVQYGCDIDTRLCGNLCTNGGRYCYPDPDWDRDSGLSGADVIEETLRQKCIWFNYGGENAPIGSQGIGEQWWTYVNTFNSNCGSLKFTDKNCISAAMSESGIDGSKITSCMDKSGGLKNSNNTILEAELLEKNAKSIVVMPTVYVNNVVERGGITLAAVLSTLCSGYADGTKPTPCNCVGQGSSEVTKLCVANNGTPINLNSSGVSVSSVFSIVIMVALAVSIIGLVYYKRTQNAMREQVRGILAEYMPLEDMDGPASSNARIPFIPGNNTSNSTSHGQRNGYLVYKPTTQSV